VTPSEQSKTDVKQPTWVGRQPSLALAFPVEVTMSSTQEAGDIFGEGSGPAQAMLRSPTVLIASIGLWGMNVYFFQLFKIDYAYVLNLDLVKEREAQLRASLRTSVEEIAEGSSKQSSKTSEIGDDDDYQDAVLGEEPEEYNGAAITWQKLIGFSVALMLLLHLSILFWIDIFGGGSIGAVFAFYGAVAIFIVLPLPATKWLRTATVIVLQRAFELFNPRCSCASSDASRPRPIPFIDVFFADGMCSLSKVFFDWGWLFHLAAHYPEPVPKSTHSILIPSLFAAVPYLIRARQCLIMLTVGRIKVRHYSMGMSIYFTNASHKSIDSERSKAVSTFFERSQVFDEYFPFMSFSISTND
jgi:hypothetical protein